MWIEQQFYYNLCIKILKDNAAYSNVISSLSNFRLLKSGDNWSG